MLGRERTPREMLLSYLESNEYVESDTRLVEHTNDVLSRFPVYQRLGFPKRVVDGLEFHRLPVLDRQTLYDTRPSERYGGTGGVAPALRNESIRLMQTSDPAFPVSVFATSNDGEPFPAAHCAAMNITEELLLHMAVLSSPLCSGSSCELIGDESLSILPPTNDVFAESDDYVRRVLERLAGLRPCLLLANPIVLDHVLCRGRVLGIEPSFQGAVLATYQRPSRLQMRSIASVLNRPVFNHYGASDLAGAIVATACASNTLHVWSKHAHVEILDDENAPVQSGHLGHIVVTNTGAQGTCLLRYRTGDLGRVHRTACACGISNSATLEVAGRRSESWIIGGRRVTPQDVDECLAAVAGIQMYQLTVGARVRLVLVPANGKVVDLAQARAAVTHLTPSVPEVLIAPRLAAGANGKYPQVRVSA